MKKKNTVIMTQMTSEELVDHHSISPHQIVDEDEEKDLGDPVEITEYILVKRGEMA